MALDRSHRWRGKSSAARIMETLLGRRSGIVAAAVTAATAASLATAAPALAGGIFDPGEHIGTFKVLDGHVQQSVDYMDSFKVTPQMQNDCWTYLFQDQGAVRLDLSFDRMETSLVASPGLVEFKNPLRVSGSGSRKWSAHVDNTPGPNADDPDCARVPANPPHANTGGCGRKTVEGAKSLLGLALAGKGGIRFSGQSVALYGGFFRKDPFEPCPADSIYATTPVLAAVSQGGARDLDNAKIGTKVKLAGRLSLPSHGRDDFWLPWNGEWVSGSQSLHIDWSLSLKRVKSGN